MTTKEKLAKFLEMVDGGTYTHFSYGNVYVDDGVLVNDDDTETTEEQAVEIWKDDSFIYRRTKRLLEEVHTEYEEYKEGKRNSPALQLRFLCVIFPSAKAPFDGMIDCNFMYKGERVKKIGSYFITYDDLADGDGTVCLFSEDGQPLNINDSRLANKLLKEKFIAETVRKHFDNMYKNIIV